MLAYIFYSLPNTLSHVLGQIIHLKMFTFDKNVNPNSIFQLETCHAEMKARGRKKTYLTELGIKNII